MNGVSIPGPLAAFAQGAVRPIANSYLLSKLDELHGDYPRSRLHRALFRQLGGEFVYAAPPGGKEQGRWLGLVRFGVILEKRFGFSAGLPVIYDHHGDLQIRTVDSLPEYLDSLPNERRSVSSDVCFVSSADQRAGDK